MAIFDDPKKELQRLQQQLLADEEEKLDELMEEDYEEYFEDEYEELYEEEDEQQDYLRNFTSGGKQSRSQREKSIFDEIEDAFAYDDDEDRYDDGDEEEPFAVFVSEKRGLFGKRKVVSETNQTDNRKLKILILLEIIAILCVAIWWVVMQL